MFRIKNPYIRWSVRGFFFILLLLIFIYLDLIIYGLRQGYGQLNILWQSKPIEVFLKDKNFPDSLKKKLRLVQVIRKFAFDSLGLTPTQNYTTLFDQKNKPLLWVVTACEPFEMKAKEWNFAFLGNMSYKGFFIKEKAEQLCQELIKQGYDAEVDDVTAWSTLGWFKDPILSSMLNRPSGSLAHLLIHELTHSTLYVKNDVDFNENLADFIGDKGAEMFLKSHFGQDSKALQYYTQTKQDNETFYAYFLQATPQLVKLYQSFPPNYTLAQKQKAKKELITQIIAGFEKLQFHHPKRFSKSFENYLPNNTFFMHFLRYRGKQHIFEQELQTQFKGNLKKYLQYLKQKYPSL